MFCALNFSSAVRCGPRIFKIGSKAPRGTVCEQYVLYTTLRALSVRRPVLCRGCTFKMRRYRSVLGVVRVVPDVYCERRRPTCGFEAPRYVYAVSYSRSACTKGESGPDGLEHVRRYNDRPPAFAQRYCVGGLRTVYDGLCSKR